MGQYWIPVNLTKREFIEPHKLGAGLKLWEQLANHPGTGAALVVLCAAMPEARGGGDFDLDENWHGPERAAAMASKAIDGMTPGPMPEDYQAVARRTIGRWAGDRIALVGDYAEPGDLPAADRAEKIYELCRSEDEGSGGTDGLEPFTDVSDDVIRVIEHELRGKYQGDGWRQWAEAGSATAD